MPKPPDYLNEFQFIKYFLFNRCHRPWTLYVEMAFPPTVIAANTLLALDVPQIARTLFRPKGPRTKRHGRKGPPKRSKPYSKIPDPNENGGQLLREAFDIGEREVSDGPRFLWTILDFGEAFLGKMFLLGLIEDWLYHYALFIDAKQGQNCGLPAVRAEGGGTRTGNPGIAFIGGCNSIWTTGGAFCFNGTVFMPTPRWMVCCSGTVQNTGGEPGDRGDVTVTIECRDGNGKFASGTGTTKTLSYMEKQDFITTVFFDKEDVSGCGFFVIQHDNPGCATESSDIVIFAQAF